MDTQAADDVLTRTAMYYKLMILLFSSARDAALAAGAILKNRAGIIFQCLLVLL